MPKIKKHIPNSITLFNIAMGLASILLASSGQFDKSAGLILASVIVDSFDGYLARRLKSTSKLGGYLDTISDFMSFGVASAYLMYKVYGIPVWIVFVFSLASGIRLWYFMKTKTTGFFYGVPTTVCGGFLATVVLMKADGTYNHILMLVLSLLMLSRQKYYRVELKSRKTLTLLFAIFLTLFVLDYKFFINAMWYMMLFYITFGWLKIKEKSPLNF